MMNNITFYGISWFIELLFLPIWFYRKIDTLFCNSSLGNGKEVNLVEEILLSVIVSIIAGVDWYVKAEDIVLKNKDN